MREVQACRATCGAGERRTDVTTLAQIGKKEHAPSDTVGRSASYKRAGKW
jgi:hypothetical protein